MNESNEYFVQKRAIEQGKISFILGLFGLLLHIPALFFLESFLLIEIVALGCGIAALVLGIISRRKQKENNGFALAGLILSILAILGCVLTNLYLFAMLSEIGDVISSYAANPW